MQNKPKAFESLAIFAASLLFGFASCIVMKNASLVPMAIIVLPLFTACLSYLFVRVQKFWVILSPFLSVAAAVSFGIESFTVTSTICCGTVAAALFALMSFMRFEPFQVLLTQIMVFSVFWGIMLCIFLVNRFGSIGAGFESLGSFACRVFDDMLAKSGAADSIGSAEKALIHQMLDSVYTVIPTVVAYVAIVSTWLCRGYLAVICLMTEDTKTVFYAPIRAPKGLAVIFILSTLFSLLSGDGSRMYLILSNLSNILMLLFAIEGVRAFIVSIRRKSRKRGVLIGFAIYALLVASAMLLPLLAYYGAFRAIFNGKKPTRPENPAR